MTNPPTTSSHKFNRKSFLAKQFILWHWVSSAVCFVSMVFFAVTGITLNHAASLKGTNEVKQVNNILPAKLVAAVSPSDGESAESSEPVPVEVASWLRKTLGVQVADRSVEWSQDEVYVSLPRPGGDAWLTIDRQTGEVVHEVTSQGWIAYLNDLHKGRNTGLIWFWFIDIFSIACVGFSLTGLGLLWVHARRRSATWPLVVAGLLVPVLIAVLFIH